MRSLRNEPASGLSVPCQGQKSHSNEENWQGATAYGVAGGSLTGRGTEPPADDVSSLPCRGRNNGSERSFEHRTVPVSTLRRW